MQKHTQPFEYESNTPPTTDWFATLLAVAFALFMAWVLVEYIITPEALLAWVEAL